ncbi:hypothetical protein [Methylobacterium sp. P5_C11]
MPSRSTRPGRENQPRNSGDSRIRRACDPALSSGLGTASVALRTRTLARIVAVLALYALALQGILGGMAAAAVGPDHVRCVTTPDPEGAAAAGKHLPVPGTLACCVACHVAGPAALPPRAPATTGPVARPTLITRQRPRRIARPRAPPRHGLGARAPPVV